MSMDATVQVRMDSQVKSEVEKLYRDLGTSFAEAVRIFARQSLKEGGLPFQPTLKTLDDLSEEDLNEMLASALKEVRAGRFYTQREVDAYVKQDFPLD